MVYRQYSRFPSFRPYATAFNVVRKRRPAGSGPSPRGGREHMGAGGAPREGGDGGRIPWKRCETRRPPRCRLERGHVLAGEVAAGDGAADGKAEHVHGVVHAAVEAAGHVAHGEQAVDRGVLASLLRRALPVTGRRHVTCQAYRWRLGGHEPHPATPARPSSSRSISRWNYPTAKRTEPAGNATASFFRGVMRISTSHPRASA